jgi:predicted patatin/cPLA2 family phospholipase
MDSMFPTPRDLLLKRSHDESVRGCRNDGWHLALVFEGGGMRGVVSIAMASAFEDRGLLSAFDSLHGSSAGACGCAYFAAGQSKTGASIYYEDINNKRVINKRRIITARPIMDTDYLVDVVMRSVKPLKGGKLR